MGKDVPARRDERELETREPVTPDRDTEKGRSPEEVLGERETRPASVTEEEKSKTPKKFKVRIDDGSGEPVIKELTLQQLDEQGLLDRLITTAGQFPGLNKKHQELLERIAGKEVGKPAAATPAKKAPPTPAQIRQVYDTVAQRDVQGGYIEPDFAEAYPQLSAQLMYWRDIVENVMERVDAAVAWIQAEAKERDVARVMGVVNDAIEAVAKKGDGEKGDPLFKDLRDSEVRGNFVEWLRTEMDPKIGSLTPDNMERFWFAFNARGILDLTKEAAKKTAEPPSKRRAGSDGPSTRSGVRESPKEKSLLERMSETRLGAEA